MVRVVMNQHTEDLRELYLDVTDEATTVTEQQHDAPSHKPVEKEDADLLSAVAGAANEHGLEDAVDGAEVNDSDGGL
jgi:division protein CdvB (Snf7/Vps24/ESCRT-III family)